MADVQGNRIEWSVYGWGRDILQRMVDGYPANRLDDLLPWNWTSISVNP